MVRHRFAHLMSQPPILPLTPFLLLPVAGLPAAIVEVWQQQQALYQWALAQAQAVVQPSLPERDLLGVWN
jgi:hypothetical protein